MSVVASRIGVTSFSFYDMDIFEIADLLAGHDLGLEVHLNDFDAEIGDPRPLTQGGVWPRTFGRDKRLRLRRAAEALPVITVHGTPWDLNIIANNPWIREESVRQYEEAMDLARDVGAGTVTYHKGRASSPLTPADVVLERHIEFARRMAGRAEEYGIRTGLENGGDRSFFQAIIEAVDSPAWGHLLDIGHAIMHCQGNTDTVLEWIDALGVDRLTEIHAHNVLAWSVGVRGMFDHQPFDDGTCLDMPVIFRRLRHVGYDGPIIFEFVRNTAQKVIDACLRARDVICDAWAT